MSDSSSTLKAASIKSSSTSCTEYSPREQWATLDKLEQLFQDLGLDVSELAYLAKGSYNTAWEFTTQTTTTTLAQGRYVLRIPLHSADISGFLTEAAVLNHLGRIRLCTPWFGKLDLTSDNALGSPYMICTRMPGQPLASVLSDGSTTLDKVTKLGEALCDKLLMMDAVDLPGAGRLASREPDRVSGLVIEPFFDIDLRDYGSVADWLRALVEHSLSHYESTAIADAKDLLFEIIGRLHGTGFLSGSRAEEIILIHGDLHFGNVLADEREGKWHISGILDWDRPVALPRCVASRSMEELWGNSFCFDERWTSEWNEDLDFVPNALWEQLDPQKVLIKKAIDRYMRRRNPEYMEEMYGLGRWARRVFKLATNGCTDYSVIKQLKEEWELEMSGDDDDTESTQEDMADEKAKSKVEESALARLKRVKMTVQNQLSVCNPQ
ncbi:hypothetical protein ANO11243_035000 [Dothideomycetidae sp. 11243]|nr:hypothetical protein ANO11243_035000 [fungal sp. No.11243]